MIFLIRSILTRNASGERARILVPARRFFQPPCRVSFCQVHLSFHAELQPISLRLDPDDFPRGEKQAPAPDPEGEPVRIPISPGRGTPQLFEQRADRALDFAQIRPADPFLGPVHRRMKPGASRNGFSAEIIDRVRLKGVDGVFIVGGHENNLRTCPGGRLPSALENR